MSEIPDSSACGEEWLLTTLGGAPISTILVVIVGLVWAGALVAYRLGWISYYRLYCMELEYFPGIYDREKSLHAADRKIAAAIWGERVNVADTDE